MPKKLSEIEDSIEYKEGVASFNLWKETNKKFEKMGLHGTDYYIRLVKKLEAKVKRLEAKLKANKVKHDMGWEE
jgi:hypothetical protein|tara:strand:+ start:351 stop:572 length:222 start_codon:yes stop_codon:yes gene_type:complete